MAAPRGGVFDEGAKFMYWNNDGHLDLVLHHPRVGPILFEFNGTRFTSWRILDPAGSQRSFGMNAYDLDNDGREDILVMGGSSCDNAVLLNRPEGFVRAGIRLPGRGSYAGLGNGGSGMALGDINRDGKIDILYPVFHGIRYFLNRTPLPDNRGSFTIEVLGENGERNQQGRVVTISPAAQPGVVVTRVVDGGSGYMVQNQYPLLVGTPYPGEHVVRVFYAVGPPVTFGITPGHVAQVRAGGSVVVTPSPAAPISGAVSGHTLGVYRASDRTFYLRNRNTPGNADVIVPYGATGDVPLVGDWDGDGVATIGVYRPSDRTFYLRNANTMGNAHVSVAYGATGDVPLVGDWDGDGVATIGVYRPSDRTFYLRNGHTPGPADVVVAYGAAADAPVIGAWVGAHAAGIGVYRPGEGTFYLRNIVSAGDAELIIPFGAPGDIPVVGDWDGDGVATIGVYRTADSTFYLRNQNTSGGADVSLPFGVPGDIPIVGDWGGEGFTSIGVYRPSEQAFLLLNDPAFDNVAVIRYGQPGDGSPLRARARSPHAGPRGRSEPAMLGSRSDS